MRSQIIRSARSFASAASKQSSRSFSGGRAAAAAAAVSSLGIVSYLASSGASEEMRIGVGLGEMRQVCRTHLFHKVFSDDSYAFVLQEQKAHAAAMEQTFIAINPDRVRRELISEIVSRFERKGFRLVAIKIPSKYFAMTCYLIFGPVLVLVWEGEGVIKYGRELMGAIPTDPQKSELGTISGDVDVVVGRNTIHGGEHEINLWLELVEIYKQL